MNCGAARGKGPGAFPLWVDVQKLCNMCVLVMELLRITRQIHCKAVEQRATLIHRQYNRDWGTSYSRPPIHPYLTSPLSQNPGGATAISVVQHWWPRWKKIAHKAKSIKRRQISAWGLAQFVCMKRSVETVVSVTYLAKFSRARRATAVLFNSSLITWHLQCFPRLIWCNFTALRTAEWLDVPRTGGLL